MEFGFSLPSRGQTATMQNMRLLAQYVEALGLDSAWVSDHIQDITISFRAPLAFANDGGTARQPPTGSSTAIQDNIGRYADCGGSHIMFDIITADVTEMQRVMERFARHVKTGVRA